MRRAVVVGAGGQLGTALQSLDWPGFDVTFADRARLDVGDEAAVMGSGLFDDADVVVNAAAWTDVDGAEEPAGEAAARRVNALAPGLLARRCAREGAFLVHVSTDYVFGGAAGAGGESGRRPLRPDDPARPDTAYGRTKLAGERAVLAEAAESGLRAAVVRTAWVYSGPTQPAAPDFVSTMLRLEARGGGVDVVADQHGNPTFVGDLAAAVVALASRPAEGVFHVTGTGAATWHELAAEVFAVAAELRGEDPAAARARVRPCTTDRFPRPAPRPAWSVLDGSSWTEAGFAPLPEWRGALRRALGAVE